MVVRCTACGFTRKVSPAVGTQARADAIALVHTTLTGHMVVIEQDKEAT